MTQDGWHWCAICLVCAHPIPIIEVAGNVRLYDAAGSFVVRARCARCTHLGEYALVGLQRLRSHELLAPRPPH